MFARRHHHRNGRFQVPEEALLGMGPGDHAKLQSILGMYSDLDPVIEEGVRELGSRNVKAEVEALNTPAFPNFLAERYVPTRLIEEGVMRQ
eukprot:m.563 g.563  ORF g.563 m.563 type:complete len:91 (-) comp788_c0_seq2:74-346(-)